MQKAVHQGKKLIRETIDNLFKSKTAQTIDALYEKLKKYQLQRIMKSRENYSLPFAKKAWLQISKSR